jgi:hypothetical protein
LEVRAPGAHGQPITAWRALPDVRDWLVAVWFWLGLGLALLLAAVSRYRGN